MNKPQLKSKLAKERLKASSRADYLQRKQDEIAETHHRSREGVSNTQFLGILEPVGNGGLRVYVPKIAAKNAEVSAGDKVKITLEGAE